MMQTNRYGLIPVKIVKAGVEGYMVGQIAGFNPEVTRSLIDRGYASELSEDEIRKAEEEAERAQAPYSPYVAPANPGGGPPGTQTGHNVADLSNQVGMVRTQVGTINQDGSVSTRSVGDMTDNPNNPVLEGGTLGSGRKDPRNEPAEEYEIPGADGEIVKVSSRYEDIHPATLKAAARRISGKDEVSLEEAKEIVGKSIEEHKAQQSAE